MSVLGRVLGSIDAALDLSNFMVWIEQEVQTKLLGTKFEAVEEVLPLLTESLRGALKLAIGSYGRHYR